MQQLWLCEGCKSFNREQSERCYSCGAQRPARVEVVQTVTPEGPVVTPGLDEYAFREAWALRRTHPYVSTRLLGYLAMALLAVATGLLSLLALFALRAVAASMAFDGRIALDDASAGLVQATTAVAAIATLAALLCHSVYLALVNVDVPALGGGTPRYSPLRAGLFWIEAAVFAIVAQISFWIPAIMVLIAWWLGVVGLVGGLVWFAVAVQLFGDPVSWLTRSQRILRDLTNHLGVPGRDDNRVVNYWTGAWLVANGISIAVACVVIVGMLLLSGVGTMSVSSVEDFIDAIAAFVTVVESVANAAAIAATLWLTATLEERIRTREAWIEASARTAGHVVE